LKVEAPSSVRLTILYCSNGCEFTHLIAEADQDKMNGCGQIKDQQLKKGVR